MHLRRRQSGGSDSEIVHYGKGNPGAIAAMLQMAGSPKYITGHMSSFLLFTSTSG